MNKILLDSDIIIDYLRKNKQAVNFIERLFASQKQIYLSVITEAELYAGASTKEYQQELEVISIVAKHQIFLIDRETAKIAGKIKRDHKMSLADALIAATAILNKCTLITSNIKHFQKISKLKVLKPV